MQQEKYEVDRKGWPSGPWDKEPDKVNWSYQGMDCMMVRNSFGAWCGYVGVPKGHPFYEKDYERAHEMAEEVGAELSVHGGLTYSGKCAGHICHVPERGRPDDVWWLGFDCAHFMDLCPGMVASGQKAGLYDTSYRQEYRDMEWVKQEVETLADQLIGLDLPSEGRVIEI